MRITHQMINRNYIKRMNNNYEGLVKSNDKLTSQRKLNKGYENVSDAGKALRVRRLIANNERAQTTIRDVKGRAAAAEDALRTSTERLTNVKDRLVEAMNGTVSEADRKLIANELAEYQNEVLALMNTQFSDKYVFAAAGNNSGGAPFTVGTSGELLFNGQAVDAMTDLGGRPALGGNPIAFNERNYVDIGFGFKLTNGNVEASTAFLDTYSGVESFGYGKDANGVPKNLFSLLGDMVNNLNANNKDGLNKDLGSIDDSMDYLLRSITSVGARGVTLDNALENLQNEYINLQEAQGKLESVDFTEETIYNKNYELSWNVTLQLGSKILPRSIFDFIS